MSIRFVADATALAAAALLLGVAAPALAFEGQSRTVSYADLDLATDAGAAALKGRIRRAAIGVCGGAEHATLAEISKRRECRTAAIASAEPQLQIVLAQAARGERFADASQVVLSAGAR